MDTLLGLRTWHWRATDWTAAAVAGLAAGAVLMVLDLLWSSFFNAHGPWRISHMIAPIFVGTAVPGAGDYAFNTTVVGIGLALHYLLGIVFGLAIAAVIEQLRLGAAPGQSAGAGAFLGAVLYLINFDVLPSFFFPWLAALRGGETLAAHMVFGIVAALLYRRLKRTAAEP
jgi:hypothetical protein